MPPPDHVIKSLAKHAESPNAHGYAGYKGIVEFREAIARYYQQRFNISLDPETEVLPLIGSKEGIVNLCLAYLDRGDVGLIPQIGYPAYAMATRLAGAEPYWVPMTQDYLLNLDAIPPEVVSKAKLLWVNYPNNPTGALATQEDYDAWVAYCLEHDLLLCSDNPYVEITYEGTPAMSALQSQNAKACTVEFISFSKTYNMAGWRLGAAVGNAAALKNLLNVKSNMDSGHFRAIYMAGIDALESTPPEWIQNRNAIYQARRDRILAALPACGLEATTPKGAMYVWAKTLDMPAVSYVERALTEAHVSVAPGGAYGQNAEQYVRFSVGTKDADLDAALESLKTWYAKQSN